MDYMELNLLEMLDTYGEDKLQSILSSFMCPQNKDVENFIQSKSIKFTKQRLAITYLVFSDTESFEELHTTQAELKHQYWLSRRNSYGKYK